MAPVPGLAPGRCRFYRFAYPLPASHNGPSFPRVPFPPVAHVYAIPGRREVVPSVIFCRADFQASADKQSRFDCPCPCCLIMAARRRRGASDYRTHCAISGAEDFCRARLFSRQRYASASTVPPMYLCAGRAHAIFRLDARKSPTFSRVAAM